LFLQKQKIGADLHVHLEEVALMSTYLPQGVHVDWLLFFVSGKAIFCGKVNRNKKGQGEPESEDETEKDAPDNKVNENGHACRQKEWWKRGNVEVKLNTVIMTAWVHQECDIMEEEALTKLQEAWDNSEQNDECVVILDDLELAYWMVTEVGQLGGYRFQGSTLGVDGSCKDGKMGSGCCKFRKEGSVKCARVDREEEGTSIHRPDLHRHQHQRQGAWLGVFAQAQAVWHR
jgi:hypothetical protein